MTRRLAPAQAARSCVRTAPRGEISGSCGDSAHRRELSSHSGAPALERSVHAASLAKSGAQRAPLFTPYQVAIPTRPNQVAIPRSRSLHAVPGTDPFRVVAPAQVIAASSGVTPLRRSWKDPHTLHLFPSAGIHRARLFTRSSRRTTCGSLSHQVAIPWPESRVCRSLPSFIGGHIDTADMIFGRHDRLLHFKMTRPNIGTPRHGITL